MTRHDTFNRRLHVEPLERRDLLCGSALGASVLQSAAQSALLARAHTSSAVTASSIARNISGGGDQTSESYLFTTLVNNSGTVEGTASYETDSNGNQKLEISVIGAAADASYSVTVGTTVLGTLMTDANGNGRLILASSTSSTSSTSSAAATSKCEGSGGATTGTLPDGFALGAGATINLASTDTSVDALNGTFATATGEIGLGNGFGGNGYGGGCHGENGATFTRLVATLSDSASTATGKALFTTITHADGTTDEILRVKITGAGADATLDVSIDGTSAGSITTDDNGNGYLILSSNPKTSNVGQLPAGLTVTSSSTITVGTTISGTFGTSSSISTATTSLAYSNRFSLRKR